MAEVKLKFTGDLYARVGAFGATVVFNGRELREFLDAVFAHYDVRDLIIDESGRLKPRARILINGRYIELLQGWDTPIREGDTIALMMPGGFMV